MRSAEWQTIVETSVLDTHTFQLVLKEPSAPFLARLTSRLGAVVSPTAVTTLGDEAFNKAPVGTGPFKFGELKTDSHVRLDRFEGYWRTDADGQPLPYLDRVEWRIMPEPGTRLTALQTGDVDLALVRDQDVALAKADKNLTVAQQAGSNFTGIYFSIDKPPFDNRALRQAVAYAIDRDEIIQAIYEGTREYADGPLPPTLAWAADPNFRPYTYDPAKAKAKLAEGGKAGGFEFTYWGPSGNSVLQQQAELIQAQLARVGIKMQIELGDQNTVLVPKLTERAGQAYAIGLKTSADPDGVLTDMFGKGGSFNFFPYDNPSVSDLLLQARRTDNQAERAAICRQAVPKIMEDSPYIFIAYGVDRYTGNKAVQNWFLGQKAATGYSEYWKARN